MLRNAKFSFHFLLIGMLVASGWAENSKPEACITELVKKAEAGDARAQRDLGLCYSKGTGVPMDEKEAVKWYRRSAERGDAMAQCLYGVCLSKGNGIAKDEKESIKWITKSAEQGDAIGQMNLGTAYRQGIVVPVDQEKCVMWWTRAAEQESMATGDHLIASRACKRELEKLKSK